MMYIPIKKPKKAAYTAAVCFVIATAFYTAGEFLKIAKMPFQLGALLVLAYGIMLVSRYLLTDYKYVITDSERADKAPSFTVIKISGKRETPVATFDFTSVYKCGRYKSTSAFEKEHGKVNKVFNYCTNYRADDSFAVAIEFNGMNVLLFVEADVLFEREISARSPEKNTEIQS